MKRRKFMQLTGTGMAISLSSVPFINFADVNGNMTAAELNTYLRSIVEVREPSVDRIIIGNPDTEIKKIGTCWMPYWDTLKKAYAQGVNVMVVHEPTFYTHWDLDAEKTDWLAAPSPARENYQKLENEKKRWINDHEMVIIRCHDVLDKVSDWGIPFALGWALGFKNDDIVRSRTYYNVYKINPGKALDVTKRIVKKLSESAHQQGVQFYGDENYPVETVGLGTGTICDPLRFADLNPDLYICIDDSIRTWIQTYYATDTGRPLVVINHGTAEEFGPRALCDHLNEHLKDIEVEHFPEGCGYRWITA